MSFLGKYKVITVTHHNLNIEDIAHFYVQTSDHQNKVQLLKAYSKDLDFDECIYLETCNRVCYILHGSFDPNLQYVKKFFKTLNPKLDEVILENIQAYVDVYQGEKAIKHIYELASSMDSLVVGEREIFRQFRKAYESSLDHKLSGDYLRLVEKTAVNAAKEVYSKTKIGEKALSVVSLAMAQMRALIEDNEQRILLVGSGETNTLVGKFLKKYDWASRVSIYNRSCDNAQALAQMLDAQSFHLKELENINSEFDTIIICTSANEEIIDDDLYSKMLGNDKEQKLLIDLAVPRNVSQTVVENYNVEYIDINTLKELSEENLNARKAELVKAQPIISKHIEKFKEIYISRQVEKAHAEVPQKIKSVKERAISDVYKERLDDLDENSKLLLLEMMDYMEKKCISIPIKSTREKILD